MYEEYIIAICIMPRKLNRPHVKKMLDMLRPFGKTVIFSPELILNTEIQKWPNANAIVSFYHRTLPFNKVFAYSNLHQMFQINDLYMQFILLDRRIVYLILKMIGIKTCRNLFCNREMKCEPEKCEYLLRRFNLKLNFKEVISFYECDEYLEINGKKIYRPFVEKPINSEDHNIYVYYKDGSVRKLFRKQGNKSSELCDNGKYVRTTGSYVYEEFLEAEENKDIKIYALGKNLAYAESRKAPTVDGFVLRNDKGKEIRDNELLTETEHDYARRITMAFKQRVCGFDVLRNNGVSYVIDVNGWSFVKSTGAYYELFSEAMKFEFQNLKKNKIYYNMKIKKMIRIYRHGDRTPKQKIKIKKPGQMLEQKEIVVNKNFAQYIKILRNIKKEHEETHESDIINILESREKENDVKLQIKFKKESTEIICKWGGLLTHTGLHQSRELGEYLRYQIIENNYELLEKVKIFSSEEDRVYLSAKAFSEGFIIPCEIIVKDKNLLNDTFHANELIEEGRSFLQKVFEENKKLEDEELYVQILSNLNLKATKNNIETEFIYERWRRISNKTQKDKKITYSHVSEVYDNLKYDCVHNKVFIVEIFTQDKLQKFFDLVKKLYCFILKNEYGMSREEKTRISKGMSENLYKKIISDLSENKEGVNIYFTKESRIYNIFNILNYSYNSLITANEFDYGSMIGLDVYEKDGVDMVRIIYNHGACLNDIYMLKLDGRHRIPFETDILLYEMELSNFLKIIQ